jgi:mannan endo-1,4-beta-mannosidase
MPAVTSSKILGGRALLVAVLVAAGLIAPWSARPASASNSRVLDYLYRISGTYTLSGQYNRQPLADPSKWSRKAYDITGKWPAVWGQDFEFESAEIAARQTMVDEAISQWNAGSLVTLSWHVCPPTVAEPCGYDTSGVKATLDDATWTALLTDGTAVNAAWKARLDTIVPYLTQLKNAGVEVLFRPLHEINETAFWWGAKTGSSRLYQITHDYLVAKGLTNLIWVWNVDDWVSAGNIANYYPGAAYVDVLSLDSYKNAFPAADYYNAMLSLAAGKPIALGEVQTVPTPANLAAQPKWTYWLPWAEYLIDPKYNTDDATKTAYYSDRTINREGLSPTPLP